MRSFLLSFSIVLIKSKTGFGYHLWGSTPSNQQIWPPVSVATREIFLFLLIALTGKVSNPTIGSSLDVRIKVFV